jgi:hypothetical protein
MTVHMLHTQDSNPVCFRSNTPPEPPFELETNVDKVTALFACACWSRTQPSTG